MGRSTSQPIDHWPQEQPVRRLNWTRVCATLLSATLLVAVAVEGASRRRIVPMTPAAPLLPTAPVMPAVASIPSARIPLADLPAASLTDLSTPLQLVAESRSQVPLGIFVRGPSEALATAVVDIAGLPGGWTISVGRRTGDRWRIPAFQLAGAGVVPPRGVSGVVDLEAELRLADDTVVEHRPVRLAITDPEESTINAKFFLSKAETLLADDDISAARLLLVRAAKAGNAKAAFLLGDTYEKCARTSGCKADADRVKAQTWYKMGADLGSLEARQRLDRLIGEDAGGPQSRR